MGIKESIDDTRIASTERDGSVELARLVNER